MREPGDKRKEDQISDAKSIDELCGILLQKAEIQGSQRFYNSMELIRLIRDLEQKVKADYFKLTLSELIEKYGKTSRTLQVLTNGEGLREKVAELLEREIKTLYRSMQEEQE